ncbi:MAG: helix-turn-helix domain-containing protein [Actinomycetota bacterium]|jgi:putative transcriptional regulator|nr:helix-turn-helix domain-containing protein [Actinomycetota bacterium]
MGELSTAFGAALTSLRRQRGWSQAALAQAVGVSRQTIIAIEQGEQEPHLGLAVALAERLQVSLDELVRTNDHEPPRRPDLWVEGEPPQYPTPVVWSRMQGRLVAARWTSLTTPTVVDAWWDPDLDLLTHLPSARPPERVIFVAGCDPFLPWLKAQFESKVPGMSLEALPFSSKRALAALRDGTIHMAGSHWYDPLSGRYNQVSSFFPFPIRQLPYLHWQEGVIQHPDAEVPQQWAIREPGSEAAALWQRCRTSSIESNQVLTFSRHEEIVEYVADHPTAAGVTIGALGTLHGLVFTPWADEEYVWCIRAADETSEWFSPLAAIRQAPTLRRLFEPMPHMELWTADHVS